MIISKMPKIIIFILSLNFFLIFNAYAVKNEFNTWLLEFKARAVSDGISKKVVDDVMDNAIFLPKVIEYDRYQPEFYEDTFTYIKKRSSRKKILEGKRLYKKEKKIIDKIENEFDVEKELLLALMGIETNFGKYLGKMDIVSSLATLSFDKRRSEFFTKELIILLNLVDKGIVKKEILYGSWAGAFGNFQFMPRTIMDFAIDYNKNSTIELKKTEDSFASAANYLKRIGWKKNQPCFFKINLKDNIPKKYLNSSARNISNKKKVNFFKKYINNFDKLNLKNNSLSAIIIPDKDIIPGAETYAPAYIVFDNYEKILTWNRSLRFALAVCTLKKILKMKFKIIILTLLLFSCSSNYTKLDKREPYYSKGFAYITEEEKPKKNSTKSANNNSRQKVFNKFLRPNTLVKIINPDTKDYIILKNSISGKYPDFYKVSISNSVANEINLDKKLPLIEILEIKKNKSFVAKKAKIFNEEKKISTNAPVTSVKISNISKNKNKKKKKTESKIYIQIASFYSEDSAIYLKKRILSKIPNYDKKKLKIVRKSNKKINLFSGPYNSISLVKNDYTKLAEFGFEDLDITINEK